MYKEKTKLQKVINYFFSLKGWEYNGDKKMKILYSRFLKPARELLELCDDDVDEVKRKLLIIKNWANSQEIEWSMETVMKRWFDLDYLPQEKEKKPFIEGCKAYQRNGRWYIINEYGEHKEYVGNKKNIIYK